jgi:cytochrome c oxidase cbb3-type subunit 3
MTRLFRVILSLGALSAGLPSCNRPPDDLREWRPTDHRHTTEATQESAEGAPQVSGSAEPTVPGLDEVTIATWRRGCVSCHGQLGRGDGPQGPMVKARDLSDPAWQASVADAQIAETITKGRGRMPPFTLPPGTVANLVRLVRLFNREHTEAAAPAPAPAASSSGAASPGAASPSAPLQGSAAK